MVLLLASVVFYAWGEPKYILLMAVQVLSGWFFGLLIERFRGRTGAKAALIGALAVGLGALAYFKYAGFAVASLNSLTGLGLAIPQIALPLGISFYTFQILSYDIDLFQGNTAVQRNILTFATYVTLFPQLIAGPIVRYADVEASLKSRTHTLERAASGARRFMLGLGKKVLIANLLGELVEICKASAETTVLIAWLYVIAFAFQIYFDFSGYSDMAIGLGRIFGFEFMENFNYPYISRSITEFWRRWHISLSSWFRDYVYIPLGGNRGGTAKHVRNILIIWLLTGLWHGAGWAFILWGLYFGALLLLEKFLLARLLGRLPRIFQHLYLIVFILIGWTIFDASSASGALKTLGLLVGIGAESFSGGESLYYLRSYAVPLIIAAVGSTPLPKLAWEKLCVRIGAVRTYAEPIVLGALLIVVTAFLVDGSFNPFIYFRF